MKTVYPVLFTKTETDVLVEVPDLGILTEGKDMSNAIEMARDAIELTCVSMEDDGKEVPVPSEMLDVNSGTFSNDECMTEKILFVKDVEQSFNYIKSIMTFCFPIIKQAGYSP